MSIFLTPCRTHSMSKKIDIERYLRSSDDVALADARAVALSRSGLTLATARESKKSSIRRYASSPARRRAAAPSPTAVEPVARCLRFRPSNLEEHKLVLACRATPTEYPEPPPQDGHVSVEIIYRGAEVCLRCVKERAGRPPAQITPHNSTHNDYEMSLCSQCTQ